MATPLIVMAANQAASREAPKAIPGSEQPKPPEPTKKKGRKSHRGSNNKKPQRGMGVAQLERLRLEDRLKKLSEPQNQTDPFHLHGYRHQYHSQKVQTTATPLSVSADPLACVPVHYGGGQVIVGSGLFSVDRGGLVVQRIGGSGTGFGRGASAGVSIAGGGVAVEDPNPYGIIGTPHQRVQVGAVYETSSELSSMPKMQSVPSDRCDTCCKKKRFNRASVGVHGSYKDKCSTMFPVSSGTGCFALEAETIATFAGNQTLGFGTARAPTTPTTGYVGRRNLDDQGVEVVAIHRKGNTSARIGGSVLVEYEFFPCGNKQDPHRRGSYFKDMEGLPTEASVAVLGGAGSSGSSSEASHINSGPATTTYGADANPVDLSLKLSY